MDCFSRVAAAGALASASLRFWQGALGIIRRTTLLFMSVTTFTVASAQGQTASKLSTSVKKFVSVDALEFVLIHARIIDGTGAPRIEDETILVDNGRIQAMGNATSVSLPAGVKVMDLNGSTVIPGLAGMHDHLFYPVQFSTPPFGPDVPTLYGEMGLSFPRLYLATGVTSMRTTGSFEPFTDLALKKMVDGGQMPGPKMHITGPYLEGTGAFTP